MSRNPRQRAFKRDTFADALVFFLGLGAAEGHHRLQPVDPLDAVGWTIETRLEPLVEIFRVFTHPFDIRMHREDGFAVLGGEIAPAIRRARLPENGTALR